MTVVSRPLMRQNNRSLISKGVVAILLVIVLVSVFGPSKQEAAIVKTAELPVQESTPKIESTPKKEPDVVAAPTVAAKTSKTNSDNAASVGGPPKSNTILKSRIFSRVPPHSKGKSGIVIQDQLMCHAYAWHRGAEYGGACGSGEYDDHRELLASIGLEAELPFGCPSDVPRDPNTRNSMVPTEKYNKDDTRIWIPEYLEFLRSKVKFPPKETDQFVIAVHVKRGIVTPCSTRRDGYSRYLPNSHYLRLIDKYMKPNAKVHIFSQVQSHEKFDDFESRGYELHLDHPTSEVWRTIAIADVVIMSRSSFSLVPSLVTNGTVVYTPFWHKPLDSWHILRDQVILDALDQDLAAMNKTCR